MNCHKCNTEYVVQKINQLFFSYCPKCKSVWIKFPHLQRLSEKLELKTPVFNPIDMEGINIKEEPRTCPDCTKPMKKVYFNGIVLDVCPDCNGILFDNGEIARFLKLFTASQNQITTLDNIELIRQLAMSSSKIKSTDIEIQSREKEYPANSTNGFAVLFLMIALALVFTIFIISANILSVFGIIGMVILVCFLPGFKLLKPQEAFVLTVFGNYIGTLRGAGFHYVNPFAQSVTPFQPVSLKARTLDNGRQKINDELGNPIEVGIIVIWEVKDTAKAVFNVDNYTQFLSSQSDSALRNIVRMYPYDATEDSGNISLRGDSQEISAKLKEEIQKNVKVAGLNIIDAKITHLAYAPEIAVAMLQRQQAAAVIDAKKTIVEGAVSMVEMALNKLNENNIVTLDDAERAKMVNNLLVILCSNKEAQPVVKGEI